MDQLDPLSLSPLNRERCVATVKVAALAAAALYLLVAFVAEPSHSLAATSDTETAIVQVTVASGMGLACDATNDGTYGSGETLSLPTITFTGDTGTYAATKQVTCKVSTNQKTGYTLSWQVLTGSGGRGTGYLISQANDQITAIGTGTTNNTFAFPSTTTKASWGGRISSTSSGSQVGNLDFGTDTSAEKYARVATGSSVAIRQSTVNSQSNGDLIRVHFRAYVGTAVVQPTGTYRATVTFTAAVQ